MMRTKSWSGNLVADANSSTGNLHREQYQPRKLLPVGSTLTAILEKPAPCSENIEKRLKKPVLRRTKTSVSLPTNHATKNDDSVFTTEKVSPRRDSDNGQHPQGDSDKGSSSQRGSENGPSPRLNSETGSVTSRDSESRSPSRRDSVYGTPAKLLRSPSIRRMSFRTIGSRVTGLIKAKNAFRRVAKKEQGDDEDIPEESFTITEMPKYPRFASTLSAEAQFAMMMGYEDIVYNRLTVSYPEYRTMLRRNRTPSTGVEVTAELHVNTPKQASENVGATKRNSSVTRDTSDKQEKTTEKDKKSKHKSSSMKLWKTPPPDYYVKPPTFSRSKSLSLLVPADKQLVMTHRYQKAMDIYDSLRSEEGVNVLSPRIKEQGNDGMSVKEFNSWAVVWNREFKSTSA